MGSGRSRGSIPEREPDKRMYPAYYLFLDVLLLIYSL
jgi:hypothetical protein